MLEHENNLVTLEDEKSYKWENLHKYCMELRKTENLTLSETLKVLSLPIKGIYYRYITEEGAFFTIQNTDSVANSVYEALLVLKNLKKEELNKKIQKCKNEQKTIEEFCLDQERRICKFPNVHSVVYLDHNLFNIYHHPSLDIILLKDFMKKLLKHYQFSDSNYNLVCEE